MEFFESHFLMSPYLLPFYFFLGACLFVLAGMGFSCLLQTQKPNSQKLASYECGEESENFENPSLPFKYYLPALIFLIFEVEIVLIAPVLLAQHLNPEGVTVLNWVNVLKIEAFLFAILLAIGYFLALRFGYFTWEQPKRRNLVFEGPVPDFAYEQFNLEMERKTTPQSI